MNAPYYHLSHSRTSRAVDRLPGLHDLSHVGEVDLLVHDIVSIVLTIPLVGEDVQVGVKILNAPSNHSTRPRPWWGCHISPPSIESSFVSIYYLLSIEIYQFHWLERTLMVVR